MRIFKTDSWVQVAISFDNLCLAWKRGIQVMVYEASKNAWVQGRITGMYNESGPLPGNEPKHFIVLLDGKKQVYVKVA